MRISVHGGDRQPQRLPAIAQIGYPNHLGLSVETSQLAVFGRDVNLDLVTGAQGDFGLDLHAGTGKIQAQSGDFLACVMEDDRGVQSHTDVVTFLAVRSVILAHEPGPLLMSSCAALITPADLTCKAA